MLDETAYLEDFARSRDGYFFLVEEFRRELPEPPKDTPEMRRKRLKAAIGTVARLCPVTLAEAKLAARFVSADQHASECLRQIKQLSRAPEKHAQLRAQSNSMARQANSAMRSLLKLQAAREKRDADAKRADAAVWAEHRAAKGMEAALEPEIVEAVVQPATKEEVSEVAVAEPASPVQADVVRSQAWVSAGDFEEAFRERLPRVDADTAFETESRSAMV